MPVGVVANVLSVVLGGVLGALFARWLGDDFKENMTLIFGGCAIAMGVGSILLMENLPAVIFSVIVGSALGMACRLGEWVGRGGAGLQRLISRALPAKAGAADAGYETALVTVIVLFCASGTGIYGSMVEGMTGDHSILLAKSVLDLFTALIFACSLGPVVAVIALPQAVVFFALYFLAGSIYPLTTPSMINDFRACGGIVLLCTGFRMMKLRDVPVADMIPAMVLVMPVSWLWTTFAAPLLG